MANEERVITNATPSRTARYKAAWAEVASKWDYEAARERAVRNLPDPASVEAGDDAKYTAK
jgi:hypothetical protein